MPGGWLWTRRSRASEVVVHAEAQVARAQAVVVAGQRERAAAEICIEIFDARRPVRRKADFHAGAQRPAEQSVRLSDSELFCPEVAVAEAEGAVHQDVVHGVAGAGAHRAKPRIGEFVAGEGVVGAGGLQVSLAAEYELAALPVVANLGAAGETVRRRVDAAHIAPFVAGVETGVKAGPVIGARPHVAVVRNRA